ncbi:hypothetical protein DEJ47_14670 [Streptomyces venezuelae]|uniref:Uncharacterized protein n=1 Tax=Streptomyces venezuelae TaxID=54571 RepID=A0A5P2BEG4_STRVZ|nr:hypothetical protein DEJ47_14670 [Streptomyces venezuelae]
MWGGCVGVCVGGSLSSLPRRYLPVRVPGAQRAAGLMYVQDTRVSAVRSASYWALGASAM